MFEIRLEKPRNKNIFKVQKITKYALKIETYFYDHGKNIFTKKIYWVIICFIVNRN